MRFPLRSSGDQQGSARGAQDAFGLHFLHLVSGQAFCGQGALDAADDLPAGLCQEPVVVKQGDGSAGVFLGGRGGFKIVPVGI
jgi:hypothetical protein